MYMQECRLYRLIITIKDPTAERVKHFCFNGITVNPHLIGGGGGGEINLANMAVSVLHKYLECKVEKLKYKKLEVTYPVIKTNPTF